MKNGGFIMTDDVGARLKCQEEKRADFDGACEACGVICQLYQQFRGNACSPTLDNLQKICAALGISLIKLLEEKPGSDYVSRAGQHEIVFEKKARSAMNPLTMARNA